MVLETGGRPLAVGRVPIICDTPFRYERWIFSLLCEGGGGFPTCATSAAKKGDVLEIVLNAGDKMGGVLD